MNQIYIYVILLEDNHYFIHHTYKKSYDQVLLEFEIYYDYLKIYRPVRVLDVIQEKDELHLDAVVKEYMYNYGYAYVRGGTYTNTELSKTEESFILRELKETTREYPNRHIISYDYLLEKYINREWKSHEEFQQEYSRLKSEFAKYQQEKMRRDALEVYAPKKTITEIFIIELEKLRDFCRTRGKDYTKVSTEYTTLYANVLPKIRHVIQKYMDTCAFPCDKYAKYMNLFPHFFMDPFFYTYSFAPCPVYLTDVTEIDAFFEAILYFANWVVCRIQELTFDVNSYHYDIEWLYPRIFYVLKNNKMNRNR